MVKSLGEGEDILKRFIYIIVLVCILAACGPDPVTLSDLYQKDIEDVTKIEIIDGSTGDKKVVNDKQIIDALLYKIQEINFIPDENQESRTGYLFNVSLFQEDDTFTFSPNQINDIYYTTEPNIEPILQEFYENLNE
ncbi:hypothetical protein [Metabacillus litoralis]|uniref:hypothetical protein n=1 Tax=Metabacillus litoralis TaxID=152268 RepID=UPI00204075F3|nr:hypothetical protein [Metabacillus litoralis]MCM3409781.1 hypothetical protein [Metabacillus litoralis]